MDNKKINVIRAVIIVAAVGLIAAGLLNDDFNDTLNKAIRICYECMGIG
jgi:hypothetical protein